MATRIMDLRGRMRTAGLTEEQADAVAAGFAVLSERIDALGERLIAVEGRMATLEGKMLALEGKMLALEGKMLALEGRITALEGQMAAFGTRLSVVQWTIGILAAVQVAILVLLVNLVMGGAG